MKIRLLLFFALAAVQGAGCVARDKGETTSKTESRSTKSQTKNELTEEELVIPPRPTGFPDYQGKKVEYWINQYQDNPGQRQEAILAIRHIGSQAVPALSKMLESEKEQDRQDAIALLGIAGFHSAKTVPTLLKLADVAKQVKGQTVYPHREAVLDTLGQIGPEAGKAVPKLLAWISDESLSANEQIKAAVALWLIDETHEPEAREVLLEQAGKGDFNAFVALGRFGPRAKSALPGLRALLTSKDDTLRLDAAGTIWAIAPETADVLPVMIEVYQNPKVKIPLIDRILWVLDEMGPAAKPMTPYLVKDIKSHKQYYWKLAPTLFKIDPWEAKKVGILAPFAARGKQLNMIYQDRPLQDWIRELQYSDFGVFSNAATAVKKMEDNAQVSVPYLVHAYNHAPVKSGIPKVALETLEQIAPAEAKKLDAKVLEASQK